MQDLKLPVDFTQGGMRNSSNIHSMDVGRTAFRLVQFQETKNDVLQS